jgi:C_GCAxxG_C_C family probable redox protein
MENDDLQLVKDSFQSGHNCAQIALSTILERKGIPMDDASYLAAGFGLGLTCGATCGAVAGAIMAMGLLEKAKTTELVDHKEATYAATKALLDRFTTACGSTKCSDLTGYDWQAPTDRQEARGSGVFQDTCPSLVATAIQIVLDLYADG